MANTTPITAGIDTAKDKLDIAIPSAKLHLTVANQPLGYKHLTRVLRRAGVGRVGIEATGGYERGVVEHLRAAAFEVIVLQPLQVKALAQMRLQRAKNDRIDAALIATCAALSEPYDTPHDPRIQPLADMLTFVEQVEEDIVRAKTRLEKTKNARLCRIIERDIKAFEARRKFELCQIMLALAQHADLKRRLELIQSVPSLGARTALAIVLRMPEIGQISREQAAALAGLAPFDNDSGSHHGAREIAGGRGRLRRSLYMAALSAAFHHNKALMSFYQRLTKRGKPHKLALVAVARKLLIFANTVVQRGTPWCQGPLPA